MADEETQPIFGDQLRARLAAARQETLAGVERPTEHPVFRLQEDGSVLLRNGTKIEKRP